MCTCHRHLLQTECCQKPVLSLCGLLVTVVTRVNATSLRDDVSYLRPTARRSLSYVAATSPADRMLPKNFGLSTWHPPRCRQTRDSIHVCRRRFLASTDGPAFPFIRVSDMSCRQNAAKLFLALRRGISVTVVARVTASMCPGIGSYLRLSARPSL